MFSVVKKSRGDFGRDATVTHVIVSGIPTKEDALVLAEVAALEHSEALNVEYKESGNLLGGHTGFAFHTNNGTYVWYEVINADLPNLSKI